MGQNFFIQLPPSSGGGDLLAGYLLLSGSSGGDPSGQLVNPRILVAGANTALIDNGTTLTISASGAPGTPGAAGPSGSAGTNGTNGTNGVAGSIFGGGLGQVGANFTVTTQGFLLVSTSVGPLAISLPVPSGSNTMVIKDCQGSASINPFTVYPTGGAKIDTLSSSYAYYANFGALKLITDGKDWFTW
jgi:hypothetical protein